MERASARPLRVPDEVSRRLALHGPVTFVAGGGAHRASVRLAVVPFDDLVVLLAHPDTPAPRALDRDPAAEIHALHPQGEYQVVIRGRALDTGPAGAHPRRAEIAPWAPEGARLQGLRAIEMVPESIEWASGARPASRLRPSGHGPPPGVLRWIQAAYDGAWPVVGVAFAATWAWIGLFGGAWRLRVLGLALCTLAGLLLVGGSRLVLRALVFEGWRQGRYRRTDAWPLSDAWMGVLTARFVGLVAVGVGVLLLPVLAAAWGQDAVLLVLVASQGWYLLPLWGLHLAQRRPDPEDWPDGRPRAPG